MWIWIDPFDVVLFRDGRPFNAGEGGHVRSQFPPMPNTLMGIIRTTILVQALAKTGQTLHDWQNGGARPSLKALLGYSSRTPGTLQAKGPLVARREEGTVRPYLPMPLDVLAQEAGTGMFHLLAPGADPIPGMSSEPLTRPLWSADESPGSAEAGERSFTVLRESLRGYLRGEKEGGAIGLTTVESDDLFQRERRLGIRLDNTRRVSEEGMLYTAEMVRTAADSGLLVCLEGADAFWEEENLPREGLLALGGERRAGRYQLLGPDIDTHIESLKNLIAVESEAARRFKLYLVTPASFQPEAGRPGWLPDMVGSPRYEDGVSSYMCRSDPLEFRLVGAAVGKPMAVSGWSLSHERPNASRRLVPAGSVYYFELERGSFSDVLERFWFKSMLADQKSEDARAGFGITLVGRW